LRDGAGQPNFLHSFFVEVRMRGLGWTPDIPDHRDYRYALPKSLAVSKLPDSVDLRKKCPAIYDQGTLGSCSANAIAAAMQFLQIKQKEKVFMPSRLGIYYMERKIERTIASDAGAQLRNGIKVVSHSGVWPEKMQPYDIARFRKAPSKACLAFGADHQAIRYERIDHTKLALLKGRLASGYPFIFGFTVFESFESAEVARTGVLHLPKRSEAFMGGHGVMAVGYSEAKRAFLVRNSWGARWGLKGYFWMPYDYLKNPDLADDFWAITEVE
jgi:C1A family cysteine protease